MSDAVPVKNCFYLRCIIDSDKLSLARSVADTLALSIASHAAIITLTIESYAKIPGTTEIWMDLEVVPEMERVHRAIRDGLGSGWCWEAIDEGEAWYTASSVWNRGEGASFVDSLVRWAHLESRTVERAR